MANLEFITALPQIDGVKVVNLRAFGDERGRFMETFRTAWFPEADWSKIQCNRSDSQPNVLRGLHYHFEQVDYWVATHGAIRAALVDLRPQSSTYLQTHTLELGETHPLGLFIPIGVAHGFVALTPCTLTYVVNNYYDGGKDEFGVAWDDPTLAVNWSVTAPILSPRDAQNRAWAAIPTDQRPR